MEVNRIQQLENVKLISSTESNCYVYKDIIYKVYKSSINARDRLDTIKFFLENNIQYCPKLYDYIYDKDEIVGYSMKNYKKAISISDINRFKLLKEKCLELIDAYLFLKDENDFCYVDFHSNNVCINNNNILLLDIDSCLKRNFENENNSKQLLKEFVLDTIYKTYFFDYEIYFLPKERQQIRNTLFKNVDNLNIDSIDDLKNFIENVSKTDIKKVLKKIPYKLNRTYFN